MVGRSLRDAVADREERIAGLVDQVRGKLGDPFQRLELADHLTPRSTPFRVLSGLGEAIDKRIVRAGMIALQLLRAIRDATKTCSTSRISGGPGPISRSLLRIDDDFIPPPEVQRATIRAARIVRLNVSASTQSCPLWPLCCMALRMPSRL